MLDLFVEIVAFACDPSIGIRDDAADQRTRTDLTATSRSQRESATHHLPVYLAPGIRAPVNRGCFIRPQLSLLIKQAIDVLFRIEHDEVVNLLADSGVTDRQV